VGPTTGLDEVAKSKILSTCQESKPGRTAHIAQGEMQSDRRMHLGTMLQKLIFCLTRRRAASTALPLRPHAFGNDSSKLELH